MATKDYSEKRKKSESAGKDWNSSSEMKHNELNHPSSWLNPNRRFLKNPFNQPSLYQNSIVVCFVCGNVARDENVTKLYSRNSRTEVNPPFFPFLEYHDPAPGADPMREDWSVVACNVCSALLTQQWKSFERARMPINKRLYWLKRPSGCEIRQPVSQIELEEILNEHSKETNVERDDSDSDDDIEEHQRKKLRIEQSADRDLKREKAASSPVRRDASNGDTDDPGTQPFICYSCGKKGSMPCSIFPVHCKPSYEQMRAGVPFYPTVLDDSQAPGSAVLYDSITFLCMNCLPRYRTEWHLMQQTFMEKDPTKTALPRIPLPEFVSCYTCGISVSTKFNDGIIHTQSSSGKKNKFHETLSSRKQLDGAASLSFGFTYVCTSCQQHLLTEKSNSKAEIESISENVSKS